MQTARIKLSGKDLGELDSICSEIKEIAKKFGTNYKGPVPLQTKILKEILNPSLSKVRDTNSQRNCSMK